MNILVGRRQVLGGTISLQRFLEIIFSLVFLVLIGLEFVWPNKIKIKQTRWLVLSIVSKCEKILWSLGLKNHRGLGPDVIPLTVVTFKTLPKNSITWLAK